MLELSLTLAPAEGALVRVLGLIERRGFRLGAIRSEPSSRGLDVFLQLPADRPGDVLLRQVQRLHDVRAASLDIARSAYPAARVDTAAIVDSATRRSSDIDTHIGAEAVPV